MPSAFQTQRVEGEAMRALIILASCLALVVGGCGSSQGEADKVDREASDQLGGQGGQDAKVFDEFMRAVIPLADIDIGLAKALAAGDFAGFEKSLDRLEQLATKGKTVGQKAEGGELRELLTGYADSVSGVAGAYRRMVDRPNADNDDELVTDIKRARDRLGRFDTQLAKAYRAALPADARDDVDAAIRKKQKEWEDAASGGG
jgi:hypothetical protein